MGGVATHSGDRTLGIFALAEGAGAVAGGNLLAHDAVPAAMLAGYGAAAGSFGDRLMAGLIAGAAAGGEAGPVHSAGLLIVDTGKLALCLVAAGLVRRRDAHRRPDPRLGRLFSRQMAAYVQRALDPREAPSYGVPGDE